MTAPSTSSLTPRSRAPIDEFGVTWWNICGDKGFGGQNYGASNLIAKDASSTIEVQSNFKTDKTTSKNTKFTKNVQSEKSLHKDVAKNANGNSIIKEKILKRVKEEQIKIKLEENRKAIINSLKVKFDREPKDNKKPDTATKCKFSTKHSSISYSGINEASNPYFVEQGKRNFGPQKQIVDGTTSVQISSSLNHAKEIHEEGYTYMLAKGKISCSVFSDRVGYRLDEGGSSEGRSHARIGREPGGAVVQASPERGSGAGGLQRQTQEANGMPVSTTYILIRLGFTFSLFNSIILTVLSLFIIFIMHYLIYPKCCCPL